MPKAWGRGHRHGVVKKSTCDYKKISTILLEKFFVSGGVLVGIVAEKYREVYNSRHKA
ncbi:MAG: hypothetical protein OEV09_13440 [Deltaproteobacteria bacterium]|nr:hypothetical protein [Deltaproteobacteria bacterium]